MLIGTIKEETRNDNYYIHLDKKDNINEVYIVHINNDNIEVLDKDKIKDLFKTLLSSKLSFLEKENDYDVYLDEANNKRYFKDGIENFFMFLENNGVSAVNYIGITSKKSKGKWYKIAVNELVFSILATSIILTPFVGDTRLAESPKYIASSVVELSSDEMTNLIKRSPNIEEEEALYLANSDYFDLVAKYSNNNLNRKYSLRKKLHKISIKHYDSEEFPGTLGYYDVADINSVHVLKTQRENKMRYRDILTHEFIHLTQNQNKYCYIIEACAEILESEFYNQPVNDYYEVIKRVKVLMEIVSPDPILECNFAGDTKKFEEAIRKHLSKEDADKLLNLLSTQDMQDADKLPDINKEIDELLAKMYKNKTGKDMKDDLMIKQIYHSNTDTRLYFNSTSELYTKDYLVSIDSEFIEELDMDDVINSKNVDYYTYTMKLPVDKKSKVKSIPVIKKEFSLIEKPEDKPIYVYFSDGTKGLISFDKEKNEWNKVKHYKAIKVYEPSISKKFPNQKNKSLVDDTELNGMFEKEEIRESQKTM